MVTNEEMKAEYQFFSEVWKLFKKYYHPQMSDEYWTDLYTEAAALGEKYDNRLCKDLILAVWKELERKYNALNGSA